MAEMEISVMFWVTKTIAGAAGFRNREETEQDNVLPIQQAARAAALKNGRSMSAPGSPLDRAVSALPFHFVVCLAGLLPLDWKDRVLPAVVDCLIAALLVRGAGRV